MRMINSERVYGIESCNISLICYILTASTNKLMTSKVRSALVSLPLVFESFDPIQTKQRKGIGKHLVKIYLRAESD